MNTGLTVRAWHDAAIARRDEDGFANATAMCQANGKRWHDYERIETTKAYIQALAASLDLTPADLVITTTTGPNEFRGTWIHPRLAVDLARWISPVFAVWMDGWFLEQLEQQPQAPGLTADDVARIAIEAARSVQAHTPRPRSKQRRPRRVTFDSYGIAPSDGTRHLDLMHTIHRIAERFGRISWMDFTCNVSKVRRRETEPDHWLAAIRDLERLGAGKVEFGARGHGGNIVPTHSISTHSRSQPCPLPFSIVSRYGAHGAGPVGLLPVLSSPWSNTPTGRPCR